MAPWASLALLGFLAFLTGFSHGLPVFHSVNHLDLNGNTCPLIPSRGVACPLLCVFSLSACPESIRPPATCPTGQTLCLDGQCKDACPANEANPCDCATGSPSSLLPCLPGHIVDLPGVIPGQLIPQTAAACGQSLSSNITSVWEGPSPSLSSPTAGRPGWLECAEPPEVALTYKEPFFLALYGWVCGQILLVALWHAYKSFVEKRRQRSEVMLHDKSLPPAGYGQDRMEVLGYRRSWPGAIVHRTVNLTSVASVVVLLLIVLDYYGFLVHGTAFGLLNSSPQSSKVFVVCWHFVSAFLLVINITSPHIDNYFRLCSPLATAHVVKIESEMEDAIVMDEEESGHGGIRWLRFIRRYQDHVSHYLGMDKVVENMPVRHTSSGQRYFEFRCVRYVFSAGQFAPWSAPVGGTHGEFYDRGQGKGLGEASAKELLDLLGPNFISVRVPGFIQALKQEFTAFFYLYQMMCLWVWLYFNYYYMALVQIVVISVSAIVKVVLRRKSEKKVKSLAEFRGTCAVRREGQWSQIDTAYLVPGDVIRVVRDMNIPCDAVLVRSDCVVDESNLTGEAMPIRKVAVTPKDPTPYCKEEGTGKAVTLFSGTRILEAKEDTEAVVTHTGTSTDKGALVKQILFPTRVIFTFDEHLRGVIILLLMWGIVAFGLTIWLMGRGDITSWFYGIFIISEIMSPLLPAALVVGQSVAAARLKAQKIQCIHLPRIMLAGKVRTFCFDKTGTLTKEGLDFVGVMEVSSAKDEGMNSGPVWKEQEDRVPQMNRTMRMGLGGCHGVTQVEVEEDEVEVIGNPVDMEQFRASGFHLAKAPQASGVLDEMTSSDGSTTLEIVRRFQFIHARASMSVALRDPHQDTGRVGVYVKGAFEKVKDMVLPSSLPEDFDQVTDHLASQGYYVLALAYKEAGEEEVRLWDRDQMEQNVHFLGLILFRNSLKSDTTEAIGELKAGAIRPVMITGDHALTGVHIARKCGMVEGGRRIFLGDVDLEAKDSLTHTSHSFSSHSIQWREVNGEGDVSENPLTQSIEDLTQSDPCIELAVTGKAFTLLVNQGRMRGLLRFTRIFSRMSPDAKVSCVRLHMEKSVTAMCGDGGNDCGALRAAHAGIALSEAEASIFPPFSTPFR
ncbi:E1-E2 ATPase-domain-containing protein, partial [Piptocephalis cylindrospora]